MCLHVEGAIHPLSAPFLYTLLCPSGESHYYILTDTTDQGNAEALGLNHSPKLVYSQGGATTAELDFNDNILVNRIGKVRKPAKSRGNNNPSAI